MSDVKLLQPLAVSASVETRIGGPVFLVEDMSSADQSTLEGNGTWLHPLQVNRTGSTAWTGLRKTIANNTLTPLFSVDMDATTSPGEAAPDYTWGGKLFFAAECSDAAGERQIREGDCNVAVSLKLPATFANGQAQNVTSANTTGTFTATFSWTFVGRIATLNVQMASSLTPVEMTINYFLLYATHTHAFIYL